MTNSSASKTNHLESLNEGRLTEWLSKYGKNVVYGLITLLVLLVAIYRFSASSSGKAEQDYINAAIDFTSFTNVNNTLDAAKLDETFLQLKVIMDRHPELHAAYDGALAQTLLDRNQVEEAAPLATATLARVQSNNLPFYSDFAATTLLISQEKYADALEKAKVLQQNMIEIISTQQLSERSFGDELFAFNLLRIAMLQQQLGDSSGELQTWKEWKQYASLDNNKALPVKINSIAFRAVIQQLAIGTVSLPDYIAYREATLTKINTQ